MSEIESSPARSKIIIDIASGHKRITDALFELKVLLSDLDSPEVFLWIDSELEGYANEADVPGYRRINGILFGTLQQISMGKIFTQTMALPVKVYSIDKTHIKMRDNITAIEEYASIADKTELAIPVDLRLANIIADIQLNDFCQITNAWIKVPPSEYTDILNAVKGRIISILIMLEKTYGNLDEYTIDFRKRSEQVKTSQVVINMIYNGNNIKIGNDNKIIKSTLRNNDGN